MKRKLMVIVLLVIGILICIPTNKKVKKEVKLHSIYGELRIITKEIVETPKEEKQEEIKKEEIKQTSYTTRMTSYYTNDGYETGSCTGSGLCAKDFQVNNKGWYTYQGKLVVATATPYLLKYGYGLASGVHTYRYYQELTLNIDGVNYRAIVLDSCGNCMRTGRVDLFVNSANNVKDTMIGVVE